MCSGDFEIDIVDVIVTHPVQHATLKGASEHTGHAAQKAEDGKVRAFRKFADAGQHEFVPSHWNRMAGWGHQANLS